MSALPQRRLALSVHADGKRLVTTVDDDGHTPKTVYTDGRVYTVLMTMSMQRARFALAWRGKLGAHNKSRTLT